MANTQKKSIADLLQDAKQLKIEMAALKARQKAQKQAIATEYADNMDEKTKADQIAQAESILNTAKQRIQALKEKFKADMKKEKDNIRTSREILEWVNYKNTHSMKKVKNQFEVNGNILKFRREGLDDIVVDTSNVNWQQIFKSELARQGINGDNRIADNIVYKASTLLNSNVEIGA